MKKLMLAVAIFAVSGASFAFCPNNVEKIYDHIKANNPNGNLPGVLIDYSSDEADWGNKIKSGLEGKGLKVTATQVAGTGVCKLRRAD